jgi:UDP-N-acetylmuramoyl-tripeptide--D-alanyl-D-alanine ligase
VPNNIFTAEEIIEITQGRLASGLMPDEAGSICTDTRVIEEGQWFLALCGETFDGHDFLGDAFAGGALGCIVQERANYPIAGTSFPLIAVDDTAIALTQLSDPGDNFPK